MSKRIKQKQSRQRNNNDELQRNNNDELYKHLKALIHS